MAIASFRAGEALTAGVAVYVSSTGFIYRASALTTTQASVAGITMDSGASGDLVRVNPDSLYTSYTGLTPGNYEYLSVATSGAVVDYATWSSEFAALSGNAYLTQVGRAVTTSGILVEIETPNLIVYSP